MHVRACNQLDTAQATAVEEETRNTRNTSNDALDATVLSIFSVCVCLGSPAPHIHFMFFSAITTVVYTKLCRARVRHLPFVVVQFTFVVARFARETTPIRDKTFT